MSASVTETNEIRETSGIRPVSEHGTDSGTGTDPTRNRIRYASTAGRYVLIALALALFGAIYEHFSFGVYSYYMIYAFAVPLALGAAPALLLARSERPPVICETARKFWRDGIAVLTVGSLFTGVIQIYGTDSRWSLAYGAAGILLLLIAVVTGAASLRHATS